MPEFEMPIEEQINRLAREFRSFGSKLDSIDATLGSINSRLTSVESKADTTHGLLEHTHALATSTHDQLTRTHILLEETHGVAKLGLEGLQGLRESMDVKFSEVAKANSEQIALLKGLFVHVRKRVEGVEQPKRPRRG